MEYRCLQYWISFSVNWLTAELGTVEKEKKNSYLLRSVIINIQILNFNSCFTLEYTKSASNVLSCLLSTWVWINTIIYELFLLLNRPFLHNNNSNINKSYYVEMPALLTCTIDGERSENC